MRKFKVMVVEDNLEAARALATLVESCGFDVLVAHDGEEALRLAVHQPPEAVLCDIGLPGRDGYAVARWLRQWFGDRPLLVAVTGHAEADFLQGAGTSSFDHYFTKPVDPSDVGVLLIEHAGRLE